MPSKAEELEEFLTPVAQSENIEIVDVQYVKENGSRVARIFIDKTGGVTMDDCEKMSYIFGDALDSGDILQESYILEISSPGINRTLKKEKDFERFIGEKIRVQTFSPINNQRNFLGKLIGAGAGKIKIDDVTKGEVEIDFCGIKKANLEADI